jgi:hypothetical protein
MADDLNGKIFPVGSAALAGLTWAFTVAADDDTTPTLVGCAIALNIFELGGTPKLEGTAIGPKIRALAPLSTTPSLVLSLGAGLTRDDNLAKSQTGTLQISDAQLESLLGTATIKAFSYQWIITPTTGPTLGTYLGGGYDGCFALGKQGWTIEALSKA